MVRTGRSGYLTSDSHINAFVVSVKLKGTRAGL